MLSSTDRLDILELLVRVDSAATQRNVDAYVGLLTDDVVLEGNEGNYNGKEQVRQSVMPIWQHEGQSSIHLTLNAEIHPINDRQDEAIATSTLLILAVGSTTTIYNVSNITQHVIKKESTWLIKKRSISQPSQKGSRI